ncbi:restriction endonuclease subunit S [Tenacibaculum maritimum]|uniref:restriction endonuclease subunit S n=1 Tax=Tenacibaculum maritimum TaxID=107401 RepID=UPI0012E56579|nr:restriction endonuclease subunit S [Tenacibaculum maritimum]CAA0149983.1 Type I restriction-modification enzyme S subunit, HsdS family [Tenacibaculum maritimum]
MELATKQGFKQTEVGLIPEDWEVFMIEDVSSVVGGGTPSTKVSSYWNGSIEWFTPTEISNVKYSYSSVRKITKEGLNNSSAQILPKGAILMTTRASIGDLSILQNEACTNQGFQSLIAKDIISNEYLYYLMLTNRVNLLRNASGSTFLEISPKKIKSIKIPLPPTLKEQKAIATALSDVDDLIASLEDLIAKKQAIKQGAMQQLLTPPHKGGKRLSGFSGEWVESELQQICEVRGGGTPPTSVLEYWNGNINWFTPTEVGSQKFIFNSTRKITALGLKSSSAQLLSKGSILLTTRASIGDAAILKNEACTNQGFQSLVPLNVKDSEFIYQLILTKRNDLISLSSGSTFLEISPKKVKTLLVYIPKAIEERDAISKILSDMDTELEQLETKKAKYQQLKQGMLQELLTGTTRLV